MLAVPALGELGKFAVVAGQADLFVVGELRKSVQLVEGVELTGRFTVFFAKHEKGSPLL